MTTGQTVPRGICWRPARANSHAGTRSCHPRHPPQKCDERGPRPAVRARPQPLQARVFAAGHRKRLRGYQRDLGCSGFDRRSRGSGRAGSCRAGGLPACPLDPLPINSGWSACRVGTARPLDHAEALARTIIHPDVQTRALRDLESTTHTSSVRRLVSAASTLITAVTSPAAARSRLLYPGWPGR